MQTHSVPLGTSRYLRQQAVTDWIEVSGTAEALPTLIVQAAQEHLPAEKR